MKIAILAHYNPNMFPVLHYLACTLGAKGHDIQFISVFEPNKAGMSSANVTWVPVKSITGWRRRFPILRSAYPAMISSLMSFKPDAIVAEHEFLVPALLYDALPGSGSPKIIGYFCDYYTDRRGMWLLKRFSARLDAYVDVCHLRLKWRQQDWPNMKAQTFIIRQAPLRQENHSFESHSGVTRIIFTGSKHALGMNRDRLSRFIQAICAHGIALDWYLAGSSAMQSSEELREEARSLCANPLFTVHAPVEKSKLMETLRGYDAGFFWAPVIENDDDNGLPSHYFESAASHKIGEYNAAGLVVARTGNPGLSYLPDEVCVFFDPTDPEAGADQLASALSDRPFVESKRKAAWHYHLTEMNFETQASPLIDYILEPTTRH